MGAVKDSGGTPAGTLPETPHLRERLWDLAALFLRLGVTAFGGPAAHIAMMEDEVVRRRKWLTSEEFLDLVGATNLIPGPSSTELAIHIGHRRAGWIGLVVAGSCFIVPAALLTLALGWAYVRFGALPQAKGVLHGVKPVIVAVVVQALWKLGRTAVKTRPLAILGVASIVAVSFRAPELLVLFAAGLLAMALPGAAPPNAPASEQASTNTIAQKASTNTTAEQASTNTAAEQASTNTTAEQASTNKPSEQASTKTSSRVIAPIFGSIFAWQVGASPGALFLVFAKIGSVLFGSGYVLLAFLRSELVAQRGWLTEAQLTDAVAAGQLTPGPVFTTATFVGYVVGGFGGAGAATFGIFLPAFVFVAASGWFVPKLRASKRAGAFLDGVNIASLALMAVVTFDLGRASLVDVPTLVLAGVSALLLLRFKVNSAWLVISGAVAGALLEAATT